ncbi:MAG: hypothetical protein GXX96_22800 [Planctomycetaceae bacterium]|nr:hypothetical protein [Planctomycetaceae bacterium]
MAAFDPYHRWLGIPPAEQPPDHYRLLGLVRYESDLEVIENAANQRMAHLRSFQAGQNAAASQRLLNEVAAARVCLLTAEKKAAYDAQLRQAEAPPARTLPQPPPAVPTPSEPVTIVPRPPSAASLSSPRIEIKPAEGRADAHLRSHRDEPSKPRFTRGAVATVVGSLAVLAVVIAIALLVGRSHPEATLVIDLGSADREDVRLLIDDVERSLPPSGPLEFACQPGAHEVIADRRGYPPFVTEVTLENRERLTMVASWDRPALLVLAWPPGEREGSRLFLDGRLQDDALDGSGSSTTIELPVEPGGRVVRIERPEFKPFEKAVTVTAGESTEVVPEFVAEAVPPAMTEGVAESTPEPVPPMPPTQGTPAQDGGPRNAVVSEFDPAGPRRDPMQPDSGQPASQPQMPVDGGGGSPPQDPPPQPAVAGTEAAPGSSTDDGEQPAKPLLPDGPVVEKNNWIDLLGEVNLARDVTRGMWRRQGSVVSSAAVASALMLPVAIQGDYELEIQFSYIAGPPHGLTLVLPVGSRACNVFLPFIDRRDVLNAVNGQPHIASVPRLETGRPITARIRVTTQNARKQIVVAVNGGPYFQWEGNEDSLSCSAFGRLPRMNQPGLINFHEQFAVHGIRFQLLEGEARQIVGPTLPPWPYLLTGAVGGSDGAVFEDFAPGKAVLAGLRYRSGGPGLVGLQPVYRDDQGQLHEGAWVGGPDRASDSAVAKEGYAVGTLTFETRNQWLSGVTVRFCRIDGGRLDLNDTYESSLLGQPGTNGTSIVETRGRPAIGVHGLWNPGQIVALGLASARAADEELWTKNGDSRREYLSLLDLEPAQCTVAETRYSRRLGVGACDPDSWPIIDTDSQLCPEFLYAPAPSRLIWKLPSTMKSFSAVGYCIESRSVRFRVLVDGQTIHESEPAGVAEIKVDLPPGDELELQVDDMGDGARDESYWLYPRVHARPAESVSSFDEKDARVVKLAGRAPLSQSIAPRNAGHTVLKPLYPVGGRCREFLYAHPPSRVVYRVPAGAKRFSAIGYCVDSKTVRFRVAVNGKEVFRSGLAGIELVQVPLPRQAETIELWIDPTNNMGISFNDQAFWCFPRFYR